VVVHGKIFGWRSLASFGVGILLVLGFVWRESSSEARWGLGASRIPQAVRGPGWLLAGPELTKAVPAPPQRTEAEQGGEAFRDGKFKTVIAAFRSLALDLPENAAVQSNLAALYLARAARPDGGPHDFILALDAAERAAHLAPRLTPALFNQAEALTQLHLPGAATAAWNRFLALAGDSPRADRAQQAMAALHEPSAFDAWQTKQERFEAAALASDEDQLRDLVYRYPFFARLRTEEILLPAWGRAASAGNSDAAGRRLAALYRIGRAFVERIHDSMVVDTVAMIEQAPEVHKLALASGLVAFGEGMARYRQVVSKDPAEPLRQAAAELTAAGCPLGLWARFYGSVPLLYRDSAAAEAVLRKLDEAVDAARYPVLSGRVQWLRGTAAIQRDRPEQAIGNYRVALDRLAASEGPQSADFLHLLLAEAFGKVGERDQEWAERLVALRAVYRTGELRGIFSALYDSIESLLAEGRPWAALAFTRELQEVAHRWNIPSTLAETGLQRGRVFDAVGDPARAVAELRQAGDFLGAIGFADFRERIGMTLAMAEGKAMAASDPEAAIPWLTSALERQRRHAYFYQQASLLSVRAMAFRALGRLPEEEDDLERAIGTFENQRLDITDPGLRQSAFEAAQSAFDRMVSLQAEGLGDAERALAYAERSRGRLLLDQLLGGKARGAFSLVDLKEALPAGTVLVEYAVLPDRLYIWTLVGRRLEFHVEPIAAMELAKLVEQLNLGIESGQVRREAPGPAAALYEHLVRPIARALPPESLLALVPDRFLAQVPFAAVFDASRGRFLIEDRVITVLPSASLLSEIDRRPRGREAAGLLAVGDPAFDRTVHGSLARLPFAADEARQIAAPYGNAVLLTGSAATRGAFVREAPGASVIHFAGHALPDPREPRRSSLMLRPDGPGESGALSAGAVAGLDLRGAGLVVLSVCRGVAGGARGRESVTGLAAGFLAAGARTVVANLWDASDASTHELMIEFHRRFRADESPAQALRSVQLAALRRGDPLAEWAGFAVLGTDGSGPKMVRGTAPRGAGHPTRRSS
jgi:CHAT domain-containing protein